MDDATMLIGLKNNNQLAFTQLYKNYYAALCSYAAKILKDKGKAEDAVHEALIKLWKNRENLQNETTFKALLYRIVHNECVDSLRKEKIVWPLQPENIPAHEDISTENAESAIIKAETIRSLMTEIDNLPDKCREIIRLSYLEKMDDAQIAIKLNIAKSTIRNQRANGLKMLKKAIPNLAFLLLIVSLLINETKN